jgi:transposase InsO family protein
MVKQFEDKTPVQDLCRWANLPRSIYYYKPSDGRRGFLPSTATFKADGSSVSNETVIEQIKTVLSGEFVCYGYQKVTEQLRQMQFIINHKKVYRLMGENNLLLGKVIKTSGKRKFVKHRRITASRPMEYLCLDIKYLWVQGENRFYFLLTIIDVYSRKVLRWILQKSVRKMDVIKLFYSIDLEYGIKGVNVRNDNGSVFLANVVKEYLRKAEANQEFTHIATPEENAYIEAYHSILESEVVQRFEFESFYEAKLTIASYVDFYNHRRLHGGIDFKTPQKMWDEYEKSKFAKSDEAEAGNAGEQPARNNLTDGDESEEVANPASSSPFLNSSLSLIPSKTQTNQVVTNLNRLEKSVQVIGG